VKLGTQTHIVETSFSDEGTEGSWLLGTAVERWSLTGELSLPCARPTSANDG